MAGTLAVVVALVLHASESRSDIAAQDSVGTPVAIDAAGCTVAPREFEDIAALASTPVPATAPDTGGATAADTKIIEAATGTIEMAVACANANDPLRSYALFTGRYLAERFGENHPDDLGSLFASLSREPVPAEEADRLALVEVRDVTTPAEGWVEATVVTENRAARYVDRLVLRLVEDRWLIDSWEPVGAD